MTGYMNTMYGNIYEGQYRNGASAGIPNGTLMVLDPTTMTMKLPAADTDTKFLCLGPINIYDGVAAFEFVVDTIAAGKRYYFIQNEVEVMDGTEYNTTEWVTPAGALIKGHPLQVGDKFCVTTTTACVKGTKYGVLATGMIG